MGGDPYTVTGGKVYITGPFNGTAPAPSGIWCAPYGLSIVNPAVAGPFNLGQVVIVRAKIEVEPDHGGADDHDRPVRARLRSRTSSTGSRLQIKHVNVNINRPEFTFNPTNCNKLQITGTLGSSEGASSALSVPVPGHELRDARSSSRISRSPRRGRPAKPTGASLP